jgi:hypothetical protein
MDHAWLPPPPAFLVPYSVPPDTITFPTGKSPSGTRYGVTTGEDSVITPVPYTNTKYATLSQTRQSRAVPGPISRNRKGVTTECYALAPEPFASGVVKTEDKWFPAESKGDSRNATIAIDSHRAEFAVISRSRRRTLQPALG